MPRGNEFMGALRTLVIGNDDSVSGNRNEFNNGALLHAICLRYENGVSF